MPRSIYGLKDMSNTTNKKQFIATTLSLVLRTVIGVGILALGVGGFLALGKRQTPAKIADKDRTPIVEVAEVQSTDELILRVDGEVQAYQESTVAAEIAGRVVFKSEKCESGKLVASSDELIRLEVEDYSINLEQLQKQEQQAQASIAELEQELKNAQASRLLRQREIKLADNEIARLRELGLGGATATAKDEAERAKIRVEDSLLTLDNQIQLIGTRRTRLELALSLAKIAVRKAGIDKDRTTIPARRNGVVVREHVEKDDYVQRGAPLFTILDTSRAEVRCNIQMEDLYWIWDQQAPAEAEHSDQYFRIIPSSATVVYELPGRQDIRYSWSGELKSYDGLGITTSSRTMPCRVVVKNPRAMKLLPTKELTTSQLTSHETDGADTVPVSTASEQSDKKPASEIPFSGPRELFRGMYVSVLIKTKPRTPLVLVPVRGLFQPGNRIWVVTPDEDDSEHSRTKLVEGIHVIQKTERLTANGIEKFWVVDVSQSNLRAGDKIVTSPMKSRLKDNKVRLKKPEAQK